MDAWLVPLAWLFLALVVLGVAALVASILLRREP